MITRRRFLQSSFGVALLSALPAWGTDRRAPRILLRNAWQTVNIGDIAHPIGILTLLEKFIPEAQVRLWPSSVADGVKELLMKRFPKLIVLSGAAAIAEGIKESDFFLHGSSSGFAAQTDLARWKKETGKPYGVFGISFMGGSAEAVELLSGAKFVFFRDSVSLKLAKETGVKAPVMEFGPDSAFGVTDVRNDEVATKFLSEHGHPRGTLAVR